MISSHHKAAAASGVELDAEHESDGLDEEYELHAQDAIGEEDELGVEDHFVEAFAEMVPIQGTARCNDVLQIEDMIMI